MKLHVLFVVYRTMVQHNHSFRHQSHWPPFMKITRIEVRTVAPEVQRFTWSFDLPEQFMTNTVVKIETDAGVQGVAGVSNYTSYDFDRYTAETIRHLAPVLIGRDPRDREQIYYDLRPRVFPLSPGALAVVDV